MSSPPILASEAKPPICEEKEKELTYHGDTRKDPFYWLRERENPAVKDFLEKETAYCKEVVAGQGAPELEKKLFEEMKLRWKETDSALPIKDKNYWYYSRTKAGLNYKIYCRRPYQNCPNLVKDFSASLQKDVDAVLPTSDDEEILLDLNKVSEQEGLEFVALGDYDVAPDETTVAFTLDLSDGGETYTIVVKDFAGEENKKNAGKEIQRIKGEIDSGVLLENGVIFYWTLDAAHRPEKLHRQKVGSEESEVLFTESNELFWPGGLSRTDDEKYVVFQSADKLSSECYFLPIEEVAEGKFAMFHPRTPKMEYNIDHHCDLFGEGKGGWLINTNADTCTNFKVECLSDETIQKNNGSTAKESWSNFLQYNPEVNIEGISCYKTFLLFEVRKSGFASTLMMKIDQAQAVATGAKSLNSGELTNVRDLMTFDDESTRAIDVVERASSGDFTSTTFRVSLSNLIIPMRIVEVDPNAAQGQDPVILKNEVVRGYDSSKYKVARLWVSATQNRCDPSDPERNLLTDGSPAKIPVTIAYREDAFKKGESPCLLYAYGSYGISIDPYFSSARVSLLDRGMVYALANIRGGGEMGRQWRNAGRMEWKMNTFTDFVDCGHAVIKEGWSHPDKLAACGRSAGGLLMGTVTNLAPSLWRTVIAGVPFVDAVTTMCDPSIPLTIPEWEEWGNPLESEKYYKIIKEYSPMDNIPNEEKGAECPTVFPNMWITSGLSDPRVAYWEPAAWTCRLRKVWNASQKEGRFLCHKCVIGAGHSGSSGRYKHLEETAEEYSFLLQSVGIKE